MSASLLRDAHTRPTTDTMPNRKLSLAISASAVSVGALFAGVVTTGRSMSAGCTDPCMASLGYQGCLCGWPMLGITSVVFTIPLAAIAVSGLIVELGRLRMTNWLLALAVGILASAGMLLSFLIKPWSVFDYQVALDVNGNGVLVNDPLQAFVGTMMFIVLLALSATTLTAIWRSSHDERMPTQRGDLQSSNQPHPHTCHSSVTIRCEEQWQPMRARESTEPARHSVSLGAATLGLCAVLVLACSSLSPVWNYSFRSYAGATSPYSLLSGKWWEAGFGHLCGSKGNATIPGSCERTYIFKLYPDTVIFYACLATFIILGASLCLPGPLAWHSWVHRRVRLPGVNTCLGAYHPYQQGATVGELVLVSATAALYGWWLWYWRWAYPRIAEEGSRPHTLDAMGVCCEVLEIPIPAGLLAPNGSRAFWGPWNSTWSEGGAGPCAAPLDVYGGLQVWARVLGHLTTLSCSLLMLPVAKNSVWFHLIGIPFERALKYHRGLGGLTYLFVTLHMALWWAKWAMEGTLWHNLTSPAQLKITRFWVHGDNFTVVLAQLAWVALTGMIGLALFARRAAYEWFYYVHVPVGLSFLGAALIHAWSFWYYSAAGLSLWAIDAMLRTVRLARPGQGHPTTATYDPLTGVTRLSFPPGAFEHHAPAQYVFLSLPCISLLERHPFTISSAPSALERTLHIKAVSGGAPGQTTFTERLAQLVEQGGVAALGDVRVDGPYGSPGDLTAFKELILIAGGIGVTPIHSVLSSLMATAQLGALEGRPLSRVRTIWTVRTPEELDLFADTLFAAARVPEGKGVVFSFAFFVTRATGTPERGSVAHAQALVNEGLEQAPVWAAPAASRWVRAHMKPGRPVLSAELQDVGDEAVIFACGPTPMTAAASALAFEKQASFHSEVFHF